MFHFWTAPSSICKKNVIVYENSWTVWHWISGESAFQSLKEATHVHRNVELCVFSIDYVSDVCWSRRGNIGKVSKEFYHFKPVYWQHQEFWLWGSREMLLPDHKVWLLNILSFSHRFLESDAFMLERSRQLGEITIFPVVRQVTSL